MERGMRKLRRRSDDTNGHDKENRYNSKTPEKREKRKSRSRSRKRNRTSGSKKSRVGVSPLRQSDRARVREAKEAIVIDVDYRSWRELGLDEEKYGDDVESDHYDYE